MSGRTGGPVKWAKIPESVIVGELLPGISSQKRASAILLYCYLDLRQGATGWPVRGYRAVAKEMGWQPRTVSDLAKVLFEVGLIELTLTEPSATSAVMRVIHNPARDRVNRDVSLGLPPKRDRHGPLIYKGSDRVRDAHMTVRDAPEGTTTPDAQLAIGSRSLRSELSEPVAERSDDGLMADENLCKECGGVTHSVGAYDADFEEFCSCPFLSVVGSR